MGSIRGRWERIPATRRCGLKTVLLLLVLCAPCLALVQAVRSTVPHVGDRAVRATHLIERASGYAEKAPASERPRIEMLVERAKDYVERTPSTEGDDGTSKMARLDHLMDRAESYLNKVDSQH